MGIKSLKVSGSKNPLQHEGGQGYGGTIPRPKTRRGHRGKKRKTFDSLGTTTQKSDNDIGWNSEARGKSLLRLFVDSKSFRWIWFSMTCGNLMSCGKRIWSHLDPSDSVRLRRASTCWNVPGKVWTIRWAFLFRLEKETVVLNGLIKIGSCVSAETVKERTLIDLHMLPTGNVLCSDRDSSLVLRQKMEL